MKKLALLIFVVTICSCKKEKDEIPTPATPSTPATTNCFPLTTGSYWIYERFNLDTNGVETVVSVDSSYISGDTVIAGNTFSIFVGDLLGPTYLNFRRDSSGYLVDQNGTIRGSNTNFTDTLWSGSISGSGDFYYKMIPGTSLSVPAGTFTAFDYLGAITITQVGYPWDTSRNIHTYFADGIGLIRETTYFLSSPNYIGRRLLRYNIQ